MELRQSDGLRRGRRAASKHDSLGPARTARARGTKRSSAKPRVAREKLEQHRKPCIARAHANRAERLRSRQLNIHCNNRASLPARCDRLDRSSRSLGGASSKRPQILVAAHARRGKELNHAEPFAIAIAAVLATRIARSDSSRLEL